MSADLPRGEWKGGGTDRTHIHSTTQKNAMGLMVMAEVLVPRHETANGGKAHHSRDKLSLQDAKLYSVSLKKKEEAI